VIVLCDWLTGNQWFYTSDKSLLLSLEQHNGDI